jgi:hypothetical protein
MSSLTLRCQEQIEKSVGLIGFICLPPIISFRSFISLPSISKTFADFVDPIPS